MNTIDSLMTFAYGWAFSVGNVFYNRTITGLSAVAVVIGTIELAGL